MRFHRLLLPTRILTPLLAAAGIGIWVNLVTDNLNKHGFASSLRAAGVANLLPLVAAGAIIFNELLVRSSARAQSNSAVAQYRIFHQRERRLLEGMLALVTDLICRTLHVACNARYFIAITADDSRTYLYQDRDLAVENVIMPKEYGFTSIAVDTPGIISGKAYLTRAPIFEELPVNHESQYSATVANMIQPEQRWVLACPVLTIDPLTSRHEPQTPPHGVLVFYGTELPRGGSRTIPVAVKYAERFADQISHVLSLSDLTPTGTAQE